MDLELKNKVALITGGDRGIGAAVSLALAGEGAHVAVNYLSNETAAANMVREIVEKYDRRAYPIQADVSDKEQVESMVGSVAEKFGRIDILVNNAGMTTHTGGLDEFTADDLAKCISVNVSGILHCTKAVAPYMKKQGGGKIINIVSFRAYATRHTSPYDISKSAALAFTVESARELAPHNIRVVSVSPGTVATDMNREKLLDYPDKLAAFEKSIPLGRIAQPEDIANLVCFLASDRARHITGTDILITGGEWFGW